MNRRQFIATLGGATAATGMALTGCDSKPKDHAAAVLGDIPTDAMEYRTGVHGERVSLLGYGCMRWPTLPDSDPRSQENNFDQDEINRMVDYAIEHGVNYFDASPAYCKGYCEEVTGKALARHPRDSYYIATKLSNFAPETWSYQASVDMYHRSLDYFHTDHIDYYLLHSVGSMDVLRNRYTANAGSPEGKEGVLDFLLEERKAGRIRNLGFSFHGDIEVFDYLLSRHDYYHWDFVQIQMNYVDWHHAKTINARNTNAEYLYSELAKRNIPAVIMEPLLGGRLATLNQHASSVLLSHEPSRSLASWAFRFCGHFPGVLTILSGMTYMEHLQDNLRSFAPFVDLTDEQLQLLEQTAYEYASFPIVPCTECQYCMPCPYGIDIPNTFKVYNRMLNEGHVNDDATSRDFCSDRRTYLREYARAVAPDRQAEHCIGCNQCTSHCPQRINIPAQLRRIDEYLSNIINH